MYRGTGLAHDVEASGWNCAQVAQDAMFSALFRLLAVDARPWPARSGPFRRSGRTGVLRKVKREGLPAQFD
jgi:hypothetical protein